MSVAATKFQKGEERYILRSQIKEAPYNPRIIGEGAEKRLRAFIKKHGLFGTIIWNVRTGNIVSGHQRLKALDYNEKYPEAGDYQLRVTVVDLTDREEKQANVFLNNPDAQGDWDVGMLGNLMQADGFTAEELGFTESTAVMMFDGDPLRTVSGHRGRHRHQGANPRGTRPPGRQHEGHAGSAECGLLLHGRFSESEGQGPLSHGDGRARL